MANNIRNNDSKNLTHTTPNRLLAGLLVALGLYFATDYIDKKVDPVKENIQQEKISDPLNPDSEGIFEQKEIAKTKSHSKEISLETSKYNISLDLQGGKITKLQLKNYVKEKDKDEKVSIFYQKQKEKNNAVTFDSGWLADNLETPNRTTQWNLIGKTANSVMLKYQTKENLTFLRTFHFNNNNFVTKIEDSVLNNSDKNVQLAHYSQIHHKGEREDKLANSFTNYTGPEALIDNERIRADYDKLKDGDKFFGNGKNVWAGVTTQYFAGVIIPDNNQQNSVNFKYHKIKDDNYYTTLVKSDVKTLNAGDNISLSYNIYAGPKSIDILKKQGIDKNINLPAMLDYGWFHPIAKLIITAINLINDHVNSLALSIIIMTILLKILLFPLANKSYHSMAEMKKIQPQIKKLQDKYGNDRQAMGLEMMKLYKEHKVSPASGCWPMLVQIPIFFAMYKVILMSFEFRQADLGLWIHDMSSRDPYFVLPILMGLTMIIQQKMNPAPADETQKMVMNIMPIAFTVMFLFFPSGLVLYWLTNNVLSVIQQYVIMKKHNA